MANTYIVSGSQFKPYTFDEMIKPALMYKQAYEDTEKKLESLEELGIDENSFLEQDAASKELYNDYMTKLQETADALNNGYNAEVAKQARNLHKTFKTKINPMKTKLAIRAALTEEQRKLKTANPYLEFSKDYSTASLDDINETSTYTTRDWLKIQEDIKREMAGYLAGQTPEFTQTPIEGIGTMITTKIGYDTADAEMQLKTNGSDLKNIKNRILKKYKSSEFDNDDNFEKFVDNTIISNAGMTTSQFSKGNIEEAGPIIDSNKRVWSQSGTYQGYINEEGTFIKDGTNNNEAGVNSKGDTRRYFFKKTTSGYTKYDYDDFISGQENVDAKGVEAANIYEGELPTTLNDFMKTHPNYILYRQEDGDFYAEPDYYYNDNKNEELDENIIPDMNLEYNTLDENAIPNMW